MRINTTKFCKLFEITRKCINFVSAQWVEKTNKNIPIVDKEIIKFSH